MEDYNLRNHILMHNRMQLFFDNFWAGKLLARPAPRFGDFEGMSMAGSCSRGGWQFGIMNTAFRRFHLLSVYHGITS
jgi:hypothetical protein